MFRPNTDGRIATVQLRWEDPDTHQVTEINGNFNTWDLAASFEKLPPVTNWPWSSPNMRMSSGTAPGLPGPRPRWLSTLIGLSSILWDDPEVVEFASLVSRASQIRALGQ